MATGNKNTGETDRTLNWFSKVRLMQDAESALCPPVSQVGNRFFIDLSAEKLFKAYRSIKIAQNGGIAKARVDILTVKVKYPKLGEQTDNFWQQYNAAYFEGEIVPEGGY
ncbi:hypothetical protein [Aggregatibacter actinomycetemcomitans]|uniref:hypothetical protein n=1 Tax=Aggregatibacter actinomycetemcomitans TaxID=714 RepID=UPI0011DD3C2F|nr:hypothetical protein [Aggregatibacter actinomycetemcomitans]QEH45264.1 hypothetical protein FXN58_06565 [Aggregatibacter actinomycetemcomitans]QEH49815.1 hypothetical protein FXN57_09485 [Aggregatibacter actinomycetemcomitans]